jgi:UDP-N-acetylmuramate--alanine ligase
LIAESAVQSGHQHVHYIESENEILSTVLDHLKPGDILLTMGAGSIWKYGEEILSKLKEN